MIDSIRDLYIASVRDRIANKHERVIWMCPELFFELQKAGMIFFEDSGTFEDSGPFCMGYSVRVSPEMTQDFKFTNA